MRLTSFGIVLVLLTSFLAGRAGAQIPERALFQPGSYAHGYAPAQGGTTGQVMMQTMLVEVPAETPEAVSVEEATDEEAEMEAVTDEGELYTLAEVQVPVHVYEMTMPYLAYHRCPLTHRIHVIPYQPGYDNAPFEFPVHQSKLNHLLSSLPSRVQDRPQVKYAGYYDPDPVIIQDKPSRCQLILGYPNGAWTSPCENRWGHRLAQCPGVVPVATGPAAEPGIKDQCLVAHTHGAYGYGYGGHGHAAHGHVGHGHGHVHDHVPAAVAVKKCNNPRCPRCNPPVPAPPEKSDD